MIKKYIFGLLAACFICISGYAQTARLYDSAGNLPNAQINDIYQDKDGFIWICSQNGLSRFDGTDFKSYNHDSSDPNSLARDLTLKVYEDAFNTKWVGTSHGLQFFDADLDGFTTFHLATPEPHISCITEYNNEDSDDSRLFISTSGAGIIVLDSRTHSQDSVMMGTVSEVLYSLYINYLFIDSRGRLWISSEIGGLSVVSANTCKPLENISWAEDIADKQSSITVYAMAEDPQTNNIVLCTVNDGILIFDAGKQMIRRAASAQAGKVKANAVIYNDLFPQDGLGTFIVGLENEGIKLLDRDENLRNAQLPNTPYDYSRWKVHCLTKDQQGNLWVGAFQTGILVVPKQIYGFNSIRLSSRNIVGENSGCITSIIKDEDGGSLWVGSDGGGVFNIADGSVTSYTDENSGLTNNSIMTLAIDNRGTLWIGTYLDGLFCKPRYGGITRFADSGMLPTEKISTMLYDGKRDRLYVGTFGGGVVAIDAATQKVSKHLDDRSLRWTGTITQDKDERLWIGATDGLVRYDPALDELKTVDSTPADQDGIVLCSRICGDKIWTGGRNGLSCYDIRTGNGTIYSMEDGIPSNSVVSLEVDREGHLWLATTNGLSHFDTGTGTFTNYYTHDGLQGNEFRQMASFMDADGIMYFGGNGGLTKVTPGEFSNESTVPPIHLTRLLVMNTPVEYDKAAGKKNILDNALAKAGRITLPHSKNFFTLSFSVPEYTNPWKIQYQYRMERFDKDWNVTDQQNPNAAYTNLSPGKYTFTVRAFYADEPGNYSERTIGIRIKAPWYLSLWAILLYALLAAAIIYFIQRVRNNQELADLQNLRLNMFTNLTHEIRTPLTLVMSPLKKLREEETSPKMKDTYNLMYRNCLRITRIVNQFMDTRKIDEGKMKLNFRETDVVYFIDDIVQSFKSMAEQQNINFTMESASPQQNIWVDQGNFDKIIFNILSNAFKYTPTGGEVKVSISDPVKNTGKLSSSISEYLEIDIFNSGSHIAARDIDKVFERFYQTSLRDSTVGSGVGLNLAKMLVDLHHGAIEAYNTDNGVNFNICIPCGKKHLTKDELISTSHHKDLYTKEIHEVVPEMDNEEDNVKLAKTRKTVIFVDDNKDMLLFLQRELKQTFNVMTFDKASVAWPVIRSVKPDAVVTDLIMPGMTGSELCQMIKNDAETALIPVIILTAQTEEEYMQEATDNAADRVLTKPISIELLSSSIMQSISTREKIAARQDNSVIYEYGSIKINSASDKLVARVMDTIKKNIDNSEFSVESLCQEVGISRVHLNRKLKELVGTSPSTLIRSIRLRQAAFLLINNEVGIAEVAFKVGYSTLSHFSNSFHEYFNMSPKEFVAKYQGTTDEEVLKKIFE